MGNTLNMFHTLIELDIKILISEYEGELTGNKLIVLIAENMVKELKSNTKIKSIAIAVMPLKSIIISSIAKSIPNLDIKFSKEQAMVIIDDIVKDLNKQHQEFNDM